MTIQTDLTPRLPDGRWALFLDIDGTLLEHAAHPDSVSVSRELRSLLEIIERRLDGALAFITGRSIAAVDHLFDPLKLRIAGLYGLEHRLTPDGQIEAADEPADMAALADEIELELASKAVYVERKGPVLAIHTRAAPHLLARATEMVEAALARLPEGYRVIAGNAGVELMPLEAAKGAAIRRFMQLDPFTGRLPVFLGDDTSDENGFDTVNAAGGISIRVKPQGETAARFAIADVASAIAWLEANFSAPGKQGSGDDLVA
ncbi:trehalose-phosphatase [Mesorhizobium sp. M1C.F.Ca.ET.193.01.1.1]|uniref:trehalose-phosphatase n=1 Tax=unclassified Mesorhizobium TaxID=325217 RepID=UPI000FD53F29|nr:MULTISPECIES: trehalose-phosphatase [unclassified Mesorhizobium]TGS98975.1 trehalose-phosphatase [bacterium M00.F.Ca.ET.177.01.1.1]TGQ53014.1 trehalose-phosphatase [Mesorhizobium sp. M1C.F.Ca.ET.210.01.1.1]TGQ70293.1 trehalose-phosphatase [Mesorhizobium sp. M1C.F.Ca.ET.212.01.1.1]TGR06622.1 trehalose-phosphatase [Mesorhizobium sp. M1C.F.Ca.ET.204.01.1.1]TGR27145.1 trehalose-phosphatase [Mesorhizobium sp. M1C.F.Ca.ET.196.01.1.1]